VQIDLARAFLGAGQQRADHDGALAPAASALARSPENLMPPSAITGMPCLVGLLGGFHDGGELRHADTGDDARGADRARADADLDRIRTGIDQRLGAFARWRRCRR
jgi:hypothetical protein